MFTKCRVGGNLLKYFKSPKDHKNLPRAEAPIELRGNPDLANRWLKSVAPAWVEEKDKPRRWVRHCRRHLAHLILCFSEPRSTVEKHLLQVAQSTELLFQIGAPRDSLYFVWYEHPEGEGGAHAHGALLLSWLTPEFGVYEPSLRAVLLQHHDRLISYTLGLEDPLERSRVRLVSAAWASWKPKCKEHILEVTGAANEAFKQEQRYEHKMFVKLLRGKGFRILAKPDAAGKPVSLLPVAPGISVPMYRNTIAVSRDDNVIVFRGPLCRPGFDADRWRESLRQREDAVVALYANPKGYYEEFAELVDRQYKEYQGKSGWPGDNLVSIKSFDWLNPKDSRRDRPKAFEEGQADPLLALESGDYPFACDDEEIAESVDDPRLVTTRSLSDDQLAMWETETIWPRSFRLPSDPAVLPKANKRFASASPTTPPAPTVPDPQQVKPEPSSLTIVSGRAADQELTSSPVEAAPKPQNPSPLLAPEIVEGLGELRRRRRRMIERIGMRQAGPSARTMEIN